jgi:hypothetical protein
MNSVKTRDAVSVSLIHHELIRTLIDTGSCPSRYELAQRLDLPVAQIEQLLSELAEIHGVVLHPHVCEPWLVHPFSITPTAHWVEAADGNWWAPCIWCAFGIATLVRSETRIHTRVGAEAEPLVIRVAKGEPVGLEDVWVHFAIPPARAWQNVHQHCSMVLPFCSREDIVAWCDRHRVPHGEDVLCIRSPSWHKFGMVRTPIRTGTNGQSPKRKRFSSGQDLFRHSGTLE